MKIIEFYNEMKKCLPDLTHSQHGIIALDLIFDRPIFKATDFIASDKIPEETARRLLKTFKNASGRQAAIYFFTKLLKIAEGHDIF